MGLVGESSGPSRVRGCGAQRGESWRGANHGAGEPCGGAACPECLSRCCEKKGAFLGGGGEHSLSI